MESLPYRPEPLDSSVATQTGPTGSRQLTFVGSGWLLCMGLFSIFLSSGRASLGPGPEFIML
jgi:hypothetical protein